VGRASPRAVPSLNSQLTQLNHQPTMTTSARFITGKIARLPDAVREQLNRRLRDHEPASGLLPWLNSLPSVKKILARFFASAPITPQNLSNWRATGFQRWLAKQIPLDLLKDHSHDARALARAARGLASGGAALAADRLFALLHPASGQELSHEELLKIIPPIISLRKADQKDLHLKHEKYKVRQRDAHLLLLRDKHQRDVAAIALRVRHDETARLIEAAPIDYEAKIELIGRHLFGEFWQPRLLPVPEPSSPPASPKSATAGEDGRAASKPGEGGPARHSFSEGGPSPSPSAAAPEPSIPIQGNPGQSLEKTDPLSLSKTSNNQPNPQKSPLISVSAHATPSPNKNDPAQPPTECPERAQDISQGSSASNVSATTPGGVIQNPAANLAAARSASPNLRPDLLADSRNDNSPGTNNLPPPEITSDKTTTQLIAEIEDYANRVSARSKSSSSSTGSSRGDEALNDNENATVPHDTNSSPTSDPSVASVPSVPSVPQLPLSDYDQARLEGKSHLEALYAQFTPTPEEIERRKRENESLRNPGGTGYQPAAPSTFNSPNPQQYYGPCPSPLGWHGFRHLDTSKVQTS
jgi:hypothetical protein